MNYFKNSQKKETLKKVLKRVMKPHWRVIWVFMEKLLVFNQWGDRWWGKHDFTKREKPQKRLIDYRSHLFSSNISPNTARTYLTKIKTFYRHFEIEVPELPNAKYDKTYETNYLDLPTKEHIRQALDLAPLEFKAIILFMSSSGTAKAETLSLTVGQFIDACKDYHGGGSIEQILDSLSKKDNIIPTFYLKRIKTDKFYYTFCSPEASSYIIRYLKTRNDLKLDDSLFNVTSSGMLHKFQEINDILGWGFKGKYRFFRSHSLRKFHASNIGLSAEYVDSLQGRSKASLMKHTSRPIRISWRKYMPLRWTTS